MRGADHPDVRVVVQRLISLTGHPDFASMPLRVAVAASWRGWKVLGAAEDGDSAAFALSRADVCATVRVDLSHPEVDYVWESAPVRARLAVLSAAFRDATLGDFLDVLTEVSRPDESNPIPRHLVQVRALLAGPVPDEAQALLALGGFHDVARVLGEESQSWTVAYEMPELRAEVRRVVEDWGVRFGWPQPVVEKVAETEAEAAVRHMEGWLRRQGAALGADLDGARTRAAWVQAREDYLDRLTPPA